jgi:methyl-accepting chemotaxis protein
MLKNVRLAYKLIAGFTVLLLMMAGIAAMTFLTARAVKGRAQLAKEESAVFAGIARRMKFDAVQVQQFLTDISATRGLDGLDDGFKKADEARKSFLAGLAQFREMYRRENENAKLKKLDDLERKLHSYHQQGTVMAKAYIDGGPGAGNKIMAAFDKAAEELAGELDPFVEEQVAELNAAMESIVVAADNLSNRALVVTLLAMALGILGGCLVTRSITRPVNVAVATMKDIAEGEGDLTARLDASGRDEIGQLASAFNQFVGKIQDVIRQAVTAAEQVTAASQQLSAASEQLSSGAQEQASSLEETAASLEEITGTVKQNADNAKQANQLAVGSRDTAEKGGEVVTNAVSAMGEINKSSKKIADIITTIDEIAFQTNLLALNAAVEAARAGEQGRGFAVVAAEVRSLAQRSATAAKEIKGLIQDSVQKVQDGSELVNKSGQTLQEIVSSVKKVTDIIGEISAASQEQSGGIDQVNKAVSQMDQVVQSNAAQTEELSSTAQSLSGQAQQLQALVGRFKLGQVTHATPVISRPAASVTHSTGGQANHEPPLHKLAKHVARTTHAVNGPAKGGEAGFEEF